MLKVTVTLARPLASTTAVVVSTLVRAAPSVSHDRSSPAREKVTTRPARDDVAAPAVEASCAVNCCVTPSLPVYASVLPAGETMLSDTAPDVANAGAAATTEITGAAHTAAATAARRDTPPVV
ncbi:hypothetical protein K8Z61_01520 [Nocardioides sp. TRM66260-LWL]|uniref:hypothetical protein n=1 Tax=Nocardioides sp. TRM66260-LWL TaxID=2874478 RepID=UPI001CC34EFB|nr:hypothetical protein [Nocardioides sp. TRM66260-LWL]MBZ5733160.1 hypothetical protein [Nocardioides sp. TRM66260-LWL]